MHIGNFVQKRGSKGTLGIITDRPPISYCWKVRWTRGENRGKVSISHEDNLALVSQTQK